MIQYSAVSQATSESFGMLASTDRLMPRFRVTLPPRMPVNDYDALRDYLKKQKLPEFVLSFEQSEEIIDAALPRAANRASGWETLRSTAEDIPAREGCLAGGRIATRLQDGNSGVVQLVKEELG